ncbi:MAG: ATP-binding protein [Bacteroidales bacterium]|nr:ATP-binding protein [Bacteroidales bacterium]
MESRLRYPVGIQTFAEIREEGYVYVDKTEIMYDMVKYGGKYVFLSRPRRFGKSLLVSTLKSYFEGRKDLFQGLAIENLEKDWTQSPVILISLAGFKSEDEERLRGYLNDLLNCLNEEFGYQGNSDSLGVRLKNLIRYCYNYTGKKVVVLIDEYDKPILNVVHDDDLRDRMRSVMSELYAPLKDCDPMLRWVFITGITKFSQMSIFSELNNVSNLSMSDDYAAICGITLSETESQLRQGILTLADKQGLTVEDTITRLRQHYDGYAFAEHSPELFNPYSLISCLKERKFDSYWFASGTPRYLINMLRRFKVVPSNIAPCYASAEEFDTPTESITNIVPLLYQSGYLTIKGYDPLMKQYILDIPNQEVRLGLMKALLPNYVQDTLMASNTLADFVRSVYAGDLNKGLTILKEFFAEIPYCNNASSEGHWQQMLFVVFSLLGAWADVEAHTATGRVDMAMVLAGKLYLFEVKLNGTVEEALSQIDIKKYSRRFTRLKLPIVKVGINFRTSDHEIVNWKIVE